MSSPAFSKAPVALRRARLDNLVLVPGSQLPYKAKWQELANALPYGSALVVMPSQASPQRTTLQSVVNSLRAKGITVACRVAGRALPQSAL